MRKAIFLLTVLILSQSTGFGQDDSAFLKKFMVGGNLGYNSTKLNDYYEFEEKTVTFNFKPVFGFILNEKITVGASVDFTLVEDDLPDYESNAEKTLSAIIFARFNNRITDKFKFYLEPYFGRKYYLLNAEDKKNKEWFIKTDFGVLYFISDSFSLELKVAGIEYSYLTVKDTDTKIQTFDLTYDIVKPNIGLRFYF
jgi:hypothetical protein